MSINIEPNGVRSIQLEIEIPGTPEEVWQAIASGPGISSWFVPCTLEPKLGGEMTLDFGAGMVSTSKITEWEPGKRYVHAGDPEPDQPNLATEWTVEAQSGGVCKVRVVNSMVWESDDWNSYLESMEGGWPAYFQVLRTYVERFSGQPSVVARAIGFGPLPDLETWHAYLGELGITGLEPGGVWQAPEGAPPTTGTLLQTSDQSEHKFALLIADAPHSGIAFFNGSPMGDSTFLGIAFFLFGEEAISTAEELESKWKAWLDAKYPPATE